MELHSHLEQIIWQEEDTRDRILGQAIRRASKWMSLSAEEAKPMVGQVGGASLHKRPVLTLKPDYVLKPLVTDHRGIREIAFYEAIRAISRNPTTQTYSTFLNGKERKKSTVNKCEELIDTFALALAIILHDSVVVESEAALKDAWKMVKREVDAIHKVAKFTAPYYGVIGQRGKTLSGHGPAMGVTEDVHLLLQDVTINYSQPCVMDLKMGTQTYEPDAPEEKRRREFGKYLEQPQFAFRIVGMRIYDPNHADADSNGFRFFQKPYGRSRKTEESIREALRIFFSAGIDKDQTNGGNAAKERIRRRAISNLLVQLRPLRRWFEGNKSLRFYASSLLIVYEGDTSKDVGNRDLASIKMIDFGRVRRESGGDPGYGQGLRTLRNMLVEILDEEDERLGVH